MSGENVENIVAYHPKESQSLKQQAPSSSGDLNKIVNNGVSTGLSEVKTPVNRAEDNSVDSISSGIFLIVLLNYFLFRFPIPKMTCYLFGSQAYRTTHSWLPDLDLPSPVEGRINRF